MRFGRDIPDIEWHFMICWRACQEQNEKIIHLMKNETFHLNPQKLSGRKLILILSTSEGLDIYVFSSKLIAGQVHPKTAVFGWTAIIGLLLETIDLIVGFL
jgi:hypothetical protein